MASGQESSVQAFLFEDDGRIPNNPTLPLLLYRGAVTGDDLVAVCRATFSANAWGGIWVDGVYDYHHYHSTAHEVLAVARGSATIAFGGEQGVRVDVVAGDVVIIPAGVGHCRITAHNLSIVGAYPAGQTWDLCTGERGERPQVLANIRAVPLPRTDPVYGSSGPLFNHWHNPSP